MDQEVDLTEFVLRGFERGIQVGVVTDIQRNHKLRAEWFDQLADLLFVLGSSRIFVGKMSEPHLRAFFVEALCDAPRNRSIVGDADDNAFLTFKQTHCGLRVFLSRYPGCVSASPFEPNNFGGWSH